MARYTKKDADGRYYIESVNGKLESDKFGHTYGEAIDRFAELENADVAPRAEVDGLRELNNSLLEAGQEWQKRYELLAREIFEEIEFDIHQLMFDNDEHRAIAIEGVIADLKKKYTEGQKC